MGAKQSTNVNGGGSVSSTNSPSIGLNDAVPGSSNGSSNRDATSRRAPGASGAAADVDWRSRARSLGNVINGLPSSSGGNSMLSSGGLSFAVSGSPDSDTDTDDVPLNRLFTASSLPVRFVSFSHGIKCPVCSKYVLPDDVECHLVMCLTKPRISYNEDVLKEEKGECVICLEELNQGDTIARLPCLCIYHKTCIDKWFDVNRSCPEHPTD